MLPGVLAAFAAALVPGGVALIATHAGSGERARTEVYGVPVRWTSRYWQPEELAAMLTSAGLEIVADLRLPPPAPELRAGVVLAARRPV